MLRSSICKHVIFIDRYSLLHNFLTQLSSKNAQKTYSLLLAVVEGAASLIKYETSQDFPTFLSPTTTTLINGSKSPICFECQLPKFVVTKQF